MKKMKTLFEKSPLHLGRITKEIRPELKDWVMNDSKAYIKRNGTSVMVKDGKVYFRYDLRTNRGKTAADLPPHAIPCQEKADEKSGHFPHWIPVTDDNISEGFNQILYDLFNSKKFENGTYEFCGPKINDNPENLSEYKLIKHDSEEVEILYKDNFNVLLAIMSSYNCIEGFVFHRNGSDEKCKLRMTDYGLNPYVNIKFGKYMSMVDKESFSNVMNCITAEDVKNSIDRVGFQKISFYLSVEDFMNIQQFFSSTETKDFSFSIQYEGKPYKNIVRYKRKLNVVDLNDNMILFKKFNHKKFQIEIETDNHVIISFLYKLGLCTKESKKYQNIVFPSSITKKV